MALLDPTATPDDDERIAFWLNLYNAILIEELARRRPFGSLLRHRGLFRSAGIEVGGLQYSLDAIEHGVLRLNARPPYALRPVLRAGDPRLAAAPSRLDPRIHFALNCGARSCPPIRAWASESLNADLEAAARSYLAAEASVDSDAGCLTLPGLMKLYRADFGNRSRQVDLAADWLPAQEREWVRSRTKRLGVSYARFDWKLAGEPRGA